MDDRDTFVDDIGAWAAGGDDNVNHWKPIARDAGVPMSELRKADVLLRSARRRGASEGAMDRAIMYRKLIGKRLLEQVQHAARSQVEAYWRHYQYFMGR